MVSIVVGCMLMCVGWLLVVILVISVKGDLLVGVLWVM